MANDNDITPIPYGKAVAPKGAKHVNDGKKLQHPLCPEGAVPLFPGLDDYEVE